MHSLAEREHGEALLSELRLQEHGSMRATVIHDVLVDLVRYDEDVPAANDICQSVEVFGCRSGASGIVRGVEQDEARALIDGATHPIPVVPELRWHERYSNATRSSKPYGRGVRIVRGIEHDHLVTRAHDGLNGGIARLGRSKRDSDLRLRIHREPIAHGNL